MRSPLDMLLRLLGRDPGPRVHAQCAEEYQRCFQTEAGRYVLGDLARACYGYDTTHQPGDPLSSAVAEGRRQVLLRIQEYTQIQPAELMELAARTQHSQQQALREDSR